MDSHDTILDQERLAALHALALLDTPAEARFDRFTRLAAMSFQVPVTLVSLVDEDRLWVKSRCGTSLARTARSAAPCSEVVASREMLVVEDASQDARFHDSPLVTGEPHIRFYAGVPLFSGGHVVGTLCLIDRQPRGLDEQERLVLRDLADLVEAELNRMKIKAERIMAEQVLKSVNTGLEQRFSVRTAEYEDKLAELSREIAQREVAEASLRQSEAWTRTIVATSYSGFVGTDSQGRVIEWNASAERIFGWTRLEAVGRLLAELIAPAPLRTALDAAMRRFIEAGEGAATDRKVELPALTASGRQITVEMTISSYLWNGERYFGAFLNDVSERIRTRQQLEEKEELLDAILESIEVAVVACDAAGNLSLFNRTARGFHGLDMKVVPPGEWPQYYSLYHEDGRTPLAPEEVPLLRALRGEVVRDQAIVVAPEDRPARTLLASGRPLRSAQGRSLGAVVAMKDITEINLSKQQLADSERLLRAVTENIPALVGKVDAQGKFAFLNGRAMRFYGKRPDELIGHDVRVAYSDEEYAKIGPSIARARAGERAWYEDAVTVNGGKLHYQCLFVPQLSSDGQPDGFYAMAFDITARKRGELAQAESEERLRTITDNVPVLIACLDQDGRYSFANAVHQSWLGQAPGNIIGRTMLDAFGEDYYLQQKDALEQAWEGMPAQCEHEIVRKKHTRIVHSTFLPHVRDGAVIGVYILTTDATASRMHERNLHALAHTDALTALPNRRQFEAALQATVAATAQAKHSCALLYLDVDYFKRINDSHGHAAGDLVLVEFARRLKKAVRGSDLVARLAGDEFTVLLEEVHGVADAELVAKKILAAMEAPFAVGARFLRVTTTVGVCVAQGQALTTAAIAEVADRALYQAKEAGRNTYEILQLDVPAPLAKPEP